MRASCKFCIMHSSHEKHRANFLKLLGDLLEFAGMTMKICVLGAGVIGLTTAWLLSERGHEVTIVDRAAMSGAGASAANGAQLSYAFLTPLACPENLWALPALLAARDGPMRLRAGWDPDFVRWGLQFLCQCSARAVTQTLVAQAALATLSRAELTRLTELLGLEFGLQTAGKLVIYRQQRAFQKAWASARLNAHLEQQVLSAVDCLVLEPALRLKVQDFVGGIVTPSEQVGDRAVFCAEITARLQQRTGVTLLLDTAVIGPFVKNGRLVAVQTAVGEMSADAFVLSLGAQSSRFARACGFRLPVVPMKGY